MQPLARVDAVGARFHEIYASARDREALGIPVLAVLGEDLVLVCGESRTTVALGHPDVALMKWVAHVPVAVFTALYASADGPLEDVILAALSGLHTEVTSRMRTLTGEHAGVSEAAIAVLEPTQLFVEERLSTATSDGGALSSLASRLTHALHTCVTLATQIQLRSLHAAVTEQLSLLHADELAGLQIVVAGDHQARARSFAMQYFQKLMREPPGKELRVTYAEGIGRVEEALALVGTKRVDVALASAFFGDPLRLQRDVLGDAARDQLVDFDLGSIPAALRPR